MTPPSPAPAPVLPLRDELRGATAYGAPQLDVPVRLNTNENPYPLPDGMAERIGARVAAAAQRLNRYPDRDAVELRSGLADYLTRTTGRPRAVAEVWAANGSNEVLQQILQAFGGPGRGAMGFEPSYSMHRLIARGVGTAWWPVPRDADFRIDTDRAVAAVKEQRPSVVFLCSPNNPTGTALDPETVLAVYEAAQHAGPALVVVDEAYVEFSHHPSLVPLVEDHPCLVVARTMSKAFGAAGLRLGYLAAHPAVVEALLLVRLPYHLSVVTQAAALAALEFTDELLSTVETVKAERDRMVRQLRSLGCPVVDSDANFVLFGTAPADAPAWTAPKLWQALLDHGVLIRDLGLPGWLRVSVGTPEENDAFLDALAACLAAGPDASAAVDRRIPRGATGVPDQKEPQPQRTPLS